MKEGPPPKSTQPRLQVLSLEDEPHDAELIQAALRAAGVAFDFQRVATHAEFLAAVQAGGFDLVLADYSLPDTDGITALRICREHRPEWPFIFVSGSLGEEAAVETLKLGAADYVLKDRLDRLPRAVERAVRQAQERAARHAAERALRTSQELYSSLVENMPQGVFRKDREGHFLFCNRRFCEGVGRSLEEILGQTDADLFPPLLAEAYRRDDLRVMESGQILDQVEEHVGAGGRKLFVQTVKSPLRDVAGVVVGVQGIFWDITERKRAEAALRESEERYRALITNSSEGIWRYEAEQPISTALPLEEQVARILQHGFLAECSDALARMYGFERADDMVGRRLQDLAGSDPRNLEYLRAFVRSGYRMVGAESFGLDRHGNVRHFENSFVGVVENGYLARAWGVQRDIAERKRAEAALRESEERYRSLVEESPDAIGMYQEGKLIFVNSTGARLLGAKTPAELLGLKAEEMIHAEDRPAAFDRIRRRLAGETGLYPAEVRYLRLDGTIIPVEVSAGSTVFGGKPAMQFIARDITERKRAEAEILRYQTQLEAIYDNTPLMMCLVNEHREVERMNRAMAELAGPLPPEGAPRHPGDSLGCLNALDDPAGCGAGPRCRTCALRLAMLETLQTGQPRRGVETSLFLARQGVRRELRFSASTALVPIAGDAKLLLCLEDITTRKQLEQQFLQAQRMEAVGQLAGGVAHDFNNILAAMILHLHLLGETHASDAGVAEALRELQAYAQRATDLTRQLLLFSRRQAIQTRRLDVNEVVAGITRMLGRLLGEHVETMFERAPEGQWVDADAGMLEQVVMNLCVNARDAMPKGGRLTLGTATVEISPEEAQRQADARVGRFVCLTLSDTGCGMDEVTLKRIFEPFFTTKEVGKGTGLGLATVYGIVRQHQGWLSVESSVGVGTTFRVYLPQTGAPDTSSAERRPAAIPRGSETILLVEDEPGVLKLAATVLRRCGYRVLEARSGVEGLRVWEETGGQAHLVLTDMIMPGGLGGLELVERLRESNPGLKAILASGYSLELSRCGAKAGIGVRFLAKPYEPAALARAVRQVLDEPT